VTISALAHIVRHPVVLGAASVLILVTALLGSVAALVWRPAAIEAQDADNALEGLNGKIRSLRAAASVVQSYTLRLSQATALEAKLSHRSSEPEFIQSIETLAASCGATIEQISSPVAEKSAAPIELVLIGSYATITKFVSGLPYLQDYVDVDRASMSRDGDNIRAYLVLTRPRQR
jgi:Tfp pilus assembly protein PilO